MIDGSQFAARREAEKAAATAAGSNGAKVKTEEVVKLFMDQDKIDAIRAEAVVVKVGRPSETLVILPLSTRDMIEAYKYLHHLIIPVLNILRQSKGGVPLVTTILETFGDNIDDVPKLFHIILRRGNPKITQEWVDENLDILLDMQLILPAFFKVNALDRLFSGKSLGRGSDSSPATETAVPPGTEESQAESTSAPTTTV